MSDTGKKVVRIYMDEVGRTGKQRYNNGKWNFNDQPYFGLGALYIPESKSENLSKKLNKFIEEQKINGEFKWSNKGARSKNLFSELMEIIKENGAKFHYEMEDKRFTISKIINDYCIIPYYDSSLDRNDLQMLKPIMKKAFASYIADNVSDELLWEICEFFDSCEQDTVKLKKLIEKIILELDSEIIKKSCLETINAIEMYEKGELKLQKHNLFPVRDTIKYNGVESTLTIDPHTDCFSDLLDVCERYFENYEMIQCIHDEQNQWEPALKEAVKRRNDYQQNKCYSYDFLTQKGYHPIINIVDYVSGYLNSCLSKILKYNDDIPDNIRQICDENLTLVVSINSAVKICRNNPEIRLSKELYDLISVK